MGVVALLQLNPTVGDIEFNASRIEYAASIAEKYGATLAISSELAICGYPPRDLLLGEDFVDSCILAIEKLNTPIPLLIGSPLKAKSERNLPYNGVIHVNLDGEIKEVYHKQLLPTYDVFDEGRYFEAGNSVCVIGQHNSSPRIGVTICEDAWQHTGHAPHDYDIDPIRQLSLVSEDISYSVNLSASPYHTEKENTRVEVVRSASKTLGHPYLLCNQVGGNDDLIFDGASIVAWPDGTMIQAPAWKEAVLIVDLENPVESFFIDLDDSSINTKPTKVEVISSKQSTIVQNSGKDILEAVTIGIRDYCRKSSIKTVVLGVSGGIDSAVTAAVACRALGPDAVHGISMPMKYSSEHSKRDARDLMERLDSNFHHIELSDLQVASEKHLQDIIPKNDEDANLVYLENIQARLRGLTVMAYANAYGAMALATGNKSELAIGYCTLYGDMCGGYAPIGDLYKTEVYELAELINIEAEKIGKVAPIPESTLTKPPSAELRPEQTDQDSLPPYNSLDNILEDWIERGVKNSEYDEKMVEWVLSTMKSNEHKRWQMPPAPRVSIRSFGQGWRQPLAAKK